MGVGHRVGNACSTANVASSRASVKSLQVDNGEEKMRIRETVRAGFYKLETFKVAVEMPAQQAAAVAQKADLQMDQLASLHAIIDDGAAGSDSQPLNNALITAAGLGRSSSANRRKTRSRPLARHVIIASCS